jgi:NADH-ubiquinone oxidoreductase chain 6
MNNYFYLIEKIINGYNINFLDILFWLAVLFSILVIISKNPIVSVLYLIGLFGSVSSYLLTLGFHFMALSYLIVYIGAVSILFLFILMLINIRISELQNNTSNSILLSLLIIFILYNTIWFILPFTIRNLHENNILFSWIYNSKESINNNPDIIWYTSNNWDSNLAEINHISSIGNILYSSHNIWLLIVSYILLLAMVGTITITINNKNK